MGTASDKVYKILKKEKRWMSAKEIAENGKLCKTSVNRVLKNFLKYKMVKIAFTGKERIWKL